MGTNGMKINKTGMEEDGNIRILHEWGKWKLWKRRQIHASCHFITQKLYMCIYINAFNTEHKH